MAGARGWQAEELLLGCVARKRLKALLLQLLSETEEEREGPHRQGPKSNSNATADASATVVGQGGVKVVAPGTRGNMASMTLLGVPEVDVKVTYEATVELNGNWVDAAGDFYFPLDIIVNNKEVELSGATNEEAVISAVANAINNYSKTYKAGTDLSTVGADSLAISWEWDFEGNDDVKDTFLGDQANNGKAGEITIGVKTTVTQVD